jgi:polyhydroxyalkanoate synthesis regulator phasin
MANKKAKKKSDTGIDPAMIAQTAFLMGIGALEMTREKLSELTDEMIERGKMSKSEAKKVSDKFGAMAKEQQDVVRETVVKETDRVMKSTGMASKSDVDSLKAEIADLKAMLAAEKSGAPKPARTTTRRTTRAKAAPKPKPTTAKPATPKPPA